MNKHMKLAVVLAGLSGMFLVSAGALAYGQSTTQTASHLTCGSMIGNTGTGMMGAGQHDSMSQDHCRTGMGGNGILGCSMMTTQANETWNQRIAGIPCR